MIAALRYEWTRFWTVRSTYIMLALSLILSAGLSFLIVQASQGLNDNGAPGIIDWFTSFSAPMTFAAVLASVLGAQAIGQEYRFGLIRLTLTEFPNRSTILVAKILMVVFAGVLIALVSYLGSWIGLAAHGLPTPPAGVTVPDSTFFGRGIVFVVLWALSSFALAGITRQTAIGIAVPIVSGLIVENILIGFLSQKAEWLVLHLPWSSAGRWAGDQGVGDFTTLAELARLSARAGASLLALIELGKAMGYELAAATTWNAVFVRTDQFPKLGLSDNGIDRMYYPVFETRVFWSINSYLNVSGCTRLIRHNYAFHPDQLQPVPPDLRNLPYKDGLDGAFLSTFV